MPAPLVHLVTGGARSGKSRYALQCAEQLAGGLTFIATAQAFDADMALRIDRHRDERGARWRTLEEPVELAAALKRALEGAPQDGGVVIDCLTLWVSNLLCGPGAHADLDPTVASDSALVARADAEIEARFDVLAGVLALAERPVWVVTNEVGLGLVPMDALSRRYRDLLGRCNQRIAAISGSVTLLVAGLPLSVRAPACVPSASPSRS